MKLLGSLGGPGVAAGSRAPPDEGDRDAQSTHVEDGVKGEISAGGVARNVAKSIVFVMVNTPAKPGSSRA